MVTKEIIDWSECPLVKVKPEVQSGAPVLRGTRMPVNAIVDNFDYGVSVAEIAEQFEVPPDCIEAILATLRATALRILFDKNVPVGVRRFLLTHEVRTVVEMRWPEQLENGELLSVAEQSGFDLMVTSAQNIRYQQNLTGRKLALVVLGSNIWPVARNYGAAITAQVDAATPGRYDFIEMPIPPRPRRNGVDSLKAMRCL